MRKELGLKKFIRNWMLSQFVHRCEYNSMSYWIQILQIVVLKFLVTHFNSAGGLIGQQMRHMWHEQNILKQTSQWQQVLTETWNWHNMDTAANNDALYIASSVTLLSSPLSILLCSLCPTWGDNKKQDRSGHLTLETESWPGASPHPRPGGHQPIRVQDGIKWPIRGRAQHMSQSSEGVSLEMSQCAKLGQRERDSGFRS